MALHTSSLTRLVGPALRPVGNAVSFSNHQWEVVPRTGALRIGGRVRITNEAGDREVMVCDVQPSVRLLSDGPVDGLAVHATVRSLEDDYPSRPDGYWTAYVVKPHGSRQVEVTVEITSGDGAPAGGDAQRSLIADLYAVAIEVRISTYGGEGVRTRVHPVILPLRWAPATGPDWREVGPGVAVLPIRTHLLTTADDPVEVVRRYAAPLTQPGDIVTIGESPLAIMQGRFRHPEDIRPSAVARRLCYLLSGVGSLGTAPGLQALIDEVGLPTVLWGLVRGSWGKLRGRDGDFYRTVGDPARLLDDVTGTLPPYDRYLVLGPAEPGTVVERIRAETGLEAAVVDANDLGAVDILAATAGVPEDVVTRSLRTNPAGNGAETTPLVVIRRSGNSG